MKREECYDILKDCLLKYIDNDYILLDLPYFSNVGDILIWQSAKDLLKEVPYKCIYSASIETYKKKEIPYKAIVIFMGGGNWGDLWIRHQKFRQRVLKDYPYNKIVQLPQSAYWKDTDAMAFDSKLFSNHRAPIILMAREKKTFYLFQEEYTFAKSVLVPDLVLSFNVQNYCKKHRIKIIEGKGKLLVQRCDAEKNMYQPKLSGENFAEISDWPCMKNALLEDKVYNVIMKFVSFTMPQAIMLKLKDFFFKNILIHSYIRSGINYLNMFESIYSTRLHAGVLAWLLGKQTFIIDNSYGKCSGVYDEWVSDQKKLNML